MANVANKYAKALFDVAIDKDRLDLMYDELSEVSEATKNYGEDLRAIDSQIQTNQLLKDANLLVSFLEMLIIT